MTKALLVFERKVLIFPVVVVVSAMMTFLWGGILQAWHWWVPLAAVLLAEDWRRDCRARIAGSLGFLACVAAMWLYCGVSIAPGWLDEQWYQMPAVHMLAEGWNPVRERTPEAIAQLFGIKVSDCRMLHIVYAAKPVWMFNAAARFFTGDILNPLVPILFFIVPGVCCRVFRSMKGCSWWWKLVAVGMLCCIAPNTSYVIDATVALSAIGMLLTFEEILSKRGFDSLSLVVFSFWLLGAKTNGLIHGTCFWTVFVMWIAIRHRKDLNRCIGHGLIVAGLILLCNATPYLTSIVDYGHPFYPRCTVDEKKYPSVDITEDFITGRNSDAAVMNWGAQFVNAYISPKLVNGWYRWRLKRPDFQIHSDNYAHYPNDSDGTYPTRFGMRVAFWFSLAVMVFARPCSFGPVALMMMFGLVLMPGPLMGYCRYISWWQAASLFAFISMVDLASGRRRTASCILAALIAGGLFSIRPWSLSRRIGFELSRFGERREFFRIVDSGRFTCLRMHHKWMGAQLFFMCRNLPSMSRVEILPADNKMYDAVNREDIHLPGRFFVLENIELMRAENKRLLAELGDTNVKRVLRSVFVALPKSIRDRLSGRVTKDI